MLSGRVDPESYLSETTAQRYSQMAFVRYNFKNFIPKKVFYLLDPIYQFDGERQLVLDQLCALVYEVIFQFFAENIAKKL